MAFNEGFLSPKLSVLTEFHLILSHLWPNFFASHKYHSYLFPWHVQPTRM